MSEKEQAKAVERMKVYIAVNLRKPIRLKELAEQAGYSPFYSARIFKANTGKAPFEYIRSMRMWFAAEVLRDEDIRVIDVAFDFLFSTHEGFTRAFFREFGMTPKKYAMQKPSNYKFLQSAFIECDGLMGEGRTMENEKTSSKAIFVQVVHKDERKLVLKRGRKANHYFAYCEEVGCEVWNILANIKESLGEPMGIWLPNTMRLPNTSKYVQGVEVPCAYQGEVPEGYELIDLPAMEMMIFQGEPFKDEEFEYAIQDLWTVMDRYNPELVGYKWDGGDAMRFQLEPQGYRGYIEGKAVRKM